MANQDQEQVTEYSEVDAPPDDVEARVLSALAGGEMYVFIVAVIDPEDGGISLRVGSEHGADVIKGLLRKTLASMP
jgi:hypothetical protein